MFFNVLRWHAGAETLLPAGQAGTISISYGPMDF